MRRMGPSLLGHYCQTRGWWFSVHNSVQETHTYGPVFTVGQLPSPLSQIQCYPHPLPKGLHCVQQTWVAPKRKDHLRKALTKCKYPKWALEKVEKRLNRFSRQVNDGGTNSAQSANHGVQNKGHIVIPYTQGLCESIIQTYIHTLGTWYSAMARVHRKVLSHALYMVVLLGATFSYCIILFLEGEPPPPRSTPWGVYRSASYARQYLFYHLTLQHSTFAPPLPGR